MRKKWSGKKSDEMEKAGLFDDMSTGGMLILASILAIIFFILCSIVVFIMNPNPEIPIVNQSCDCINQSNFSNYVIPDGMPDTSKVISDPACNDYCYLRACQHGCAIWINQGLKNGRCLCFLDQCVIRVESESNESG